MFNSLGRIPNTFTYSQAGKTQRQREKNKIKYRSQTMEVGQVNSIYNLCEQWSTWDIASYASRTSNSMGFVGVNT